MCTIKGAVLMDHCTSRHPKEDPAVCFPDKPWERVEAPAAASGPAAAPKKAKAKPADDLSALLDAGLTVSKKKK